MQTFSVAVGDYAGFSFRVNPTNTAIVEFSFTAPYAEPGEIDTETKKVSPSKEPKDHNIIAEFNRNGGLLGYTRIPVENASELRRDRWTGRPRRATEAELNAEEELRLEREEQLKADKEASDKKAEELKDSRAKRVEKPVEPVVASKDAKPEVEFDQERGVPAGR